MRENSGTHNNEWIVTDYNKFQAGQELQPDTVWMVDQMVNYSHRYDMLRL